MQELFHELGRSEPTLMNLLSSDGRRFVQKYHDFLIKESQFMADYLKWVRENEYVWSDRGGWYKDEFDIVIVNALTYITDQELLNLYIESKK